MKVRSLFLGLFVAAVLCSPTLFSRFAARAADAETKSEPVTNSEASIITITNAVESADLQELRTKIDALQRANDLALGRWSALLDQNNSLSNVLISLQQTLESERQREVQLSEQARVFNTRVMLGAAAAMFLVFLASYWFQLRCLNRVMEIATAPRELPAPYQPALLEAANARESQLLEAVKLLENRIRQLESPAASAAIPATIAAPVPTTNGSTENGASKIMDTAPAEPVIAANKVSVLLAKGEVLLETERLQEALTSFNEAVALEPQNSEAHLKKGIALERLNRLEPALISYNESLRINPKRSFAYVYKARVLAALHRYDEALSVYDMALGKTQKAATTTATGDFHRANAG